MGAVNHFVYRKNGCIITENRGLGFLVRAEMGYRNVRAEQVCSINDVLEVRYYLGL